MSLLSEDLSGPDNGLMREPTPVITSPTGRPALSLSQAARETNVSRSTIRRRHEAGDFAGAFKDAGQAWRIPFDDLVTAGMIERTSPPDAIPAQARSTAPPTAAPVTAPTAGHEPAQSEVTRLRALLIAAEHRAVLAERTAQLLTENLSDVRRALLAITAAPATEQNRSVEPAESLGPIGPIPKSRPRKWFSRR